MEIKKLLGHRLYLEYPEEPKSNIILDEQSKALLEQDKLKKWGRLTVYAVGSSITDISEGDEVMIDPAAAAKVYKVHLSDERTVLLVSSFDIAHVW